MRDFKKYEVWELSHKLTLEIYEITKAPHMLYLLILVKVADELLIKSFIAFFKFV